MSGAAGGGYPAATPADRLVKCWCGRPDSSYARPVMFQFIKHNANGAELGPVLETIENALRADQAKLIEAE